MTDTQAEAEALSQPPLPSFEHAMHHALMLAGRSPAFGINPQVGCVLIDSLGQIVSEGWHHGAGTAHAEVDALANLQTKTGRPDASGLTAVVTLEPCNHTGRTGPCSEALIESGVDRVVYAITDPGPHSAGGAARLRDAGIGTIGGILADVASESMRVWLTAVRLRRPFVSLKWASSLDGRTAAADGTSRWITGTAARQRVHEQRGAVDAILVGTGTILADDPSLTARGDGGELLTHQPIPVVVGVRQIPAQSRVFDHPNAPIISGSRDLAAVLHDLFDRGIRHLYVEGGPTIADAFVAAGLVDEFLIYLAPTLIGGPQLALHDIGVRTIGDVRRLDIDAVEVLGHDLLVTARPAAHNASRIEIHPEVPNPLDRES